MDSEIHFQVQGQHGPMTLTFRFLGRHPCAGPEITEATAARLTLEEVQEWYTRHGFPRAGVLCTNLRGRYAGLFAMV